MTGTTGISTDTLARILAEYDATRPRDASDSKALCRDTSSVVVPSVTKTYWENLLGTHFMSPCIDERVIAIADYTIPPTPLTSSWTNTSRMSLYRNNNTALENGYNGTPTPSYLTNDGIQIDGTNSGYISYNDTEFLQSLAGKTVTIELKNPVGYNNTSSWTKAYIADF
jgi:hypothetical protein